MAPIGKTLVFAGIAITFVGLLLWGFSSVPLDREAAKRHLYTPRQLHFLFIGTYILISIIATIFFSLMRR